MNELRIYRIANSLVAQNEAMKISDNAKEVAGFLDESPKPTVVKFHAWAEEEGYEVSTMEAAGYELGTLFVSFMLYGRANDKHISAEDVDKQELAMGRKIEMEHTNNVAVAERIALDHLSEASNTAPLKYYTALKLMEKMIESLEKMDKSMAAEKISEFKKFVNDLGGKG